MKHDLHPSWTTTGAPHDEENQSVEQCAETRDEWSAEGMESSPQRIPVRRSIPAVGTLIVGTLAGVCGIVVVGFLFLQGTLLLQASLTGEIVPDHIIMLLETGFETTDAEIGETVEFHNTLSTVEEYRSETPDAKTGMPLITTSAIPPSGSVRIKIPAEAAGEELLLMSGFHPARSGTINVADGEDSFESSMQDASPAAQDTVEFDDIGLNTAMPLPSLQSSNAAPSRNNAESEQRELSSGGSSSPAHQIAPYSTSQVAERPMAHIAASLPEEILDLGTIVRTTPIALPWPSAIRTNRFTVGSALVPDLSHAVSIPTILGKKHSSAGMPTLNNGDQIAHRAPATGPELWVLVLLSFAIVPIYLIRRRS